MDDAFEQTLLARASVGAGLEHISFLDQLRMERELAVQEDLETVEGLDLARAVSELSEKKTAYEAALAMAGNAVKTSLLNYL